MQRAAPKVLFHSTLGVLLVACLSYMCIAIVGGLSQLHVHLDELRWRPTR
jgi:hypothetical protein